MKSIFILSLFFILFNQTIVCYDFDYYDRESSRIILNFYEFFLKAFFSIIRQAKWTVEWIGEKIRSFTRNNPRELVKNFSIKNLNTCIKILQPLDLMWRKASSRVYPCMTMMTILSTMTIITTMQLMIGYRFISHPYLIKISPNGSTFHLFGIGDFA